jgi:SAM-dependent methyltransferase
METYEPETYWSRVGQEIRRRGRSEVAGDDNPLLAYKRQKFLDRFLDTLDFRDRVVLELGFGPGGNLKHIAQRHRPRRLLGADISQTMCDLAARNLRAYRDIVELHKIDGRELPLADRSVDLGFTVTVLQHVTHDGMFRSLVGELCRVARTDLVIMEDIGTRRQMGGPGSWVGRTVEVYRAAFSEHGFRLSDVQFLRTAVSRSWYRPLFMVYRRCLNRRHHEGEPMGRLTKLAMGGLLSLSRPLDELVPDRRDLARMVFRRT